MATDARPGETLSLAAAERLHQRPTDMIDRSNPLWFKNVVIYEAHVKAFFDSNKDGVGDFAGLTHAPMETECAIADVRADGAERAPGYDN